ncbi:MAG: phosphomethylpyrimidine synthase ThiC [Spirochaetales bacterium]|nr:phosphomethylpyrimidine synthase ThiC [Spirochaetales bacterium]
MYKTQMEAAKKGIVTKEMLYVSKNENIEMDILLEEIANGRLIIPGNVLHSNIQPRAIGEKASTKVNVNLGISKDCIDKNIELSKAKKAIELNVDAIMDLSCWGDTREFRKKLVELSPVMIGTVPMYDMIGNSGKALINLTKEDFFKCVLDHAKDGIDFMTIHAGLNRKTAERVKNNKRLTNIVSRGGSLLFAWMEMTGNENPFYEYYDEFLDIMREYDVTISLGDGCRPGSLYDATDASQIEELITLGELTKRAWAKDVSVMVEGPGHIPLNEVKTNIILAKKLLHNAPFYVLGPLVTDIAPGYDHITSAIGGAVAAQNGADFLCYVTPAEHLRLPDEKDMIEGIMAVKIAAHAGDVARGFKGAIDKDHRMSRARAELDWEKMINLSIDPYKSKKYRGNSQPEIEETCTMCGEMCAIKNMNNILNGEKVTI